MITERLARAFVDALAGPDVRALRVLLAPDARFWINIGPVSFSVEERLALLEQERSHLRALALEEVRIDYTRAGFVVQASTVMTTTSDVELRVPVCLVAATRDGRIAHVEEYADSAPATPLLELMAGGA